MTAPIVCKAGVRFGGFSAGLTRILLGLARLSDRWLVMVTSGSDGQHMEGSRHYSFEAVDVRTKHLSAPQKAAFLDALRTELGTRFTVLLEGEGTAQEHCHIQVRKGGVYSVESLRQV